MGVKYTINLLNEKGGIKLIRLNFKNKLFLFLIIIFGIIFLVGCSNNNVEETGTQIKEITIGYFPNVTHAPAIVGIEKGIFQQEFDNIKVKTRIFPNGSLFMDALNTGQIDIGYVGPGPALNRFLQGAEVKALASASTGGTVLIARRDLEYQRPEDLKGKIVATPARGCTHDLIFRKMLIENNLATTDSGGQIEHRTQKPATMIGLFAQGQLDAAMVSEPWASLMEDEIGAKVVVDWNQVPWDGQLPATIVVSTNEFINNNPDLIKLFLKGHLKAIDFIKNNPENSVRIISREISRLTKQKLSVDVIKRSLDRTYMTAEIKPEILQELADLSAALGFIKGNSSLNGFIDTTYLKEVLDNVSSQ